MRIKLLKSSLAVILASVLTLGISFASILAPTSVEQNDKIAAIMQQLQLAYPNLDINSLKAQILYSVEHPTLIDCGSCQIKKYPEKRPGFQDVIYGHIVCVPCVP